MHGSVTSTLGCTLRWPLFFRGFGILNILLVLKFAILMQPCKLQHYHTHVHSEAHENCRRKFTLRALLINLWLQLPILVCLSCAVWENIINTGPRLYMRYFLPFMKEVIPTINMPLPPEKVCQVLLLSWWLATFQKRCQGLHSWRRMTHEAEEYEPEAKQDWAWR